MQWIHEYQLFLFDFDGLLVNTEMLHFKAYQRMCSDRGFDLNWSEQRYAQIALFSATALKEQIYKKFPDLYRYEPCWEVLYKEKKQAYLELLYESGVELMPGVASFLEQLHTQDIKMCIVTNSAKAQVDLICQQHAVLDKIERRVTREDYEAPKPSPECYQLALSKYASAADRAIGFEDSPRGLKALIDSGAEPVFISSVLEKQEVGLNQSFHAFKSFSVVDLDKK